jgi:hypothetical protein
MKPFLESVIILTSILYLFQSLKSLHLFNAHFRSRSLSRSIAILSFVTSDLLFFSLILLFFNTQFWWYSLLSATITSQILIFTTWKELKFLSLTNIFFLLNIFIYSNTH